MRFVAFLSAAMVCGGCALLLDFDELEGPRPADAGVREAERPTDGAPEDPGDGGDAG